MLEIKIYVTIELPEEYINQYNELMENPERIFSDEFDFNIINLEIK